jgi:hypothetical protein
MKFFDFILISNCLIVHSVYPDDVQDIPEPSHPLYFLYSKHHNQLPKNGAPNTACPMREILVEEVVMSYPSTSLLIHLYSKKEDTQHVCEHDPCLLHPLVFEHSQYYIFEQPNHDNVPEHHPLKHDIDTSLPKQYEQSNDLQNENLPYIVPSCKTKKFIETKVPAINCRVLTIF